MEAPPTRHDSEVRIHVDDELRCLRRQGYFGSLECHFPRDGHDTVDAGYMQFHGP